MRAERGWNPIRSDWTDPSPETGKAIVPFRRRRTSAGNIPWRDRRGGVSRMAIASKLLSRAKPGADEIQLDLFGALQGATSRSHIRHSRIIFAPTPRSGGVGSTIRIPCAGRRGVASATSTAPIVDFSIPVISAGEHSRELGKAIGIVGELRWHSRHTILREPRLW